MGWLQRCAVVRFLAAAVAEDERHHSHDQKDHEKDLRDASSPSRNAAKTENCRDQRDDKKNNGVMQHKGSCNNLGCIVAAMLVFVNRNANRCDDFSVESDQLVTCRSNALAGVGQG